MSRSKRNRESKLQTVAESRLRKPAWRRWWPAIVAGACLIVAAVFWPRDDAPKAKPQPTPDQTARDTPDRKEESSSSATNAKPSVPLERAVGKWNRPGEPYVLEIKRIGSDGRAEAAYSNPNPINVARAEVTASDDGINVFVELRDVNYPGCTYRLRYEPERDLLYGEYFQAKMGQTHEVVFVRLPASK